MGRLDDYAKKRIVELRKAGLSFRKIKKVLELDNIRVTPQAIYLFLKRKNMDPGPLPGSSHPLPPRDQNSRLLALRRAGWEDEQLWDLLQESEVEPKESLESQPAGPRGETGAGQSWDGEEGIKIVSVRSLCEDGVAHPKDACSSEVPRASANSDAGIGLVAPGPVSQPASPHPLNRGRACMPSPRNSALIVKKKIVDRAIYLHKKATVQNVQRGTGSSSLPLLVGVQSSGPGPGLPDLKDSSPQVQDMSTQTRLPCASAQGLAEKLDAVQGAVQQVLQVLQMLTDQQSRLERQQEQQQRWQQQVLGTLQQLREPTHSQGPGARETQDLGNLGTLEGPNFCQFKMELL
ncbi:uncharacterized protein LOC103104852 [Monodelphis domestica]|uniref:uncharacterized protein LOC103104852 n=1 Tax=Monodelphis domestica TaxID=13616 RepID=UPI0004434A7A|nr:uncharacterized protein LOC103104852 [Monodelphis domestica]XP_007499465.1 uncharacterized protein LOC103104852 [Monodelphis domestica]